MGRLAIDGMLQQARDRLVRLPPAGAYEALARGETLIDIRTGEQIRADGRIPGALEISLNVLEWRVDPASSHRAAEAPDLDAVVVLICDQGFSSSLAASRLQDLGFMRATDVIGGFQAWRAEGLPISRSPDATRADVPGGRIGATS